MNTDTIFTTLFGGCLKTAENAAAATINLTQFTFIPAFSDLARNAWKRAEAYLRQLSAQLLHAQDEERRQISRELHDSIGQELAAVAINLGWIKQSASQLAA